VGLAENTEDGISTPSIFRLVASLACIAFAGSALAACGEEDSDTGSTDTSQTQTSTATAATTGPVVTDGCRVTQPNGKTPPGETADGDYFGNGKIWTVLPADAQPDEVRPDGSSATKFPWWRGSDVRGKLVIRGRRLDGQAPPAGARIPGGYGGSGFQSSSVIFPEDGCWRLTGRVGDAQLTLTVLVQAQT